MQYKDEGSLTQSTIHFPWGKCKIVFVLITQNTRNINIQHLRYWYTSINICGNWCVRCAPYDQAYPVFFSWLHFWQCSVHRGSGWIVEDLDFEVLRYHEASKKISSIHPGPHYCQFSASEKLFGSFLWHIWNTKC